MEGDGEDLAIVYDRARRLLASTLSVNSSLVEEQERAMSMDNRESNYRSVNSSERAGSPRSQVSEYSQMSAAFSNGVYSYPAQSSSYNAVLISAARQSADSEERYPEFAPDVYQRSPLNNAEAPGLQKLREENADKQSLMSYDLGNTETLQAVTVMQEQEEATPRTETSRFAHSLKCADHLVNKVTGMLEKHRPTARVTASLAVLRGEMFEFLSELAVDALALRWRIVTDVRAVEAGGDLRRAHGGAGTGSGCGPGS